MKSFIDCLLIPGYFDEKYLKVDATPCRMAYWPISGFSVTLHVLYLPHFFTLSSFSLNFLTTSSFSRRHLTFCYSSVVCFNFDHLRRTWRAWKIKYLNTVVKGCVDEKKKMKPLHCKTVLEAYCSRDSFIAMKIESSFTTLVGLRGWHVYQKSTWKNPKKVEALSFKK